MTAFDKLSSLQRLYPLDTFLADANRELRCCLRVVLVSKR